MGSLTPAEMRYSFGRMRRALVRVCLLAGLMSLVAAPASADPPQTADQLAAQQHFQHAKELYQAGSYKEAVAELEAARTLDPKAKDLVFNLGIVHEKLQKFDEAIDDFRAYLDMEGLTSAEKQKAEMSIKRIEGAKKEVPPTPSSTNSSQQQLSPPPPDRAHESGRIDALTITAAAVSVVGLGLGTIFGIRAIATKPSDFVTGRDGTYADLQDKTDSAHTSAIISDVGFGVGIVGAAAAAWLFFGRDKDTTTASVAPIHGGGAVFIGGTFR